MPRHEKSQPAHWLRTVSTLRIVKDSVWLTESQWNRLSVEALSRGYITTHGTPDRDTMLRQIVQCWMDANPLSPDAEQWKGIGDAQVGDRHTSLEAGVQATD